MLKKEWTKSLHHSKLDVGLLHAYYVQHAYPRHSHDYYVISLIERGRQSFTHQGTKLSTPPGGLILINPGVGHTGEAVDAQGFELRALYPSISLMETAVFGLTGRRALPFFKQVRVEHHWATNSILSLHKAILEGAGMLECESRTLWMMTQLIKRYADIGSAEGHLGKEKRAIRQARHYIDEHFSESVTLSAFKDGHKYHSLTLIGLHSSFVDRHYLRSCSEQRPRRRQLKQWLFYRQRGIRSGMRSSPNSLHNVFNRG